MNCVLIFLCTTVCKKWPWPSGYAMYGWRVFYSLAAHAGLHSHAAVLALHVRGHTEPGQRWLGFVFPVTADAPIWGITSSPPPVEWKNHKDKVNRYVTVASISPQNQRYQINNQVVTTHFGHQINRSKNAIHLYPGCGSNTQPLACKTNTTAYM